MPPMRPNCEASPRAPDITVTAAGESSLYFFGSFSIASNSSPHRLRARSASLIFTSNCTQSSKETPSSTCGFFCNLGKMKHRTTQSVFGRGSVGKEGQLPYIQPDWSSVVSFDRFGDRISDPAIQCSLG